MLWNDLYDWLFYRKERQKIMNILQHIKCWYASKDTINRWHFHDILVVEKMSIPRYTKMQCKNCKKYFMSFDRFEAVLDWDNTKSCFKE